MLGGGGGERGVRAGLSLLTSVGHPQPMEVTWKLR
jgi:hypothetical protein